MNATDKMHTTLGCLIRLSLTEANEPILADIDPSLVDRLLDLLLLKDEEMVLMVLEYFYQYSSISTEAATRIAEYSPPKHLIELDTLEELCDSSSGAA
ncbi:hypothetical protein BJ742DRAFT_778384 [Cladochytrium replicatum]|nr:hypothetical protein BJ742DRAFT_778384 [Cladochytrium replicatum]